MKKLISLTIISFLFIYSRAQVKFGVTAGLNFSNIVSSSGITSSSADLFHGGFLVDYKLPNSNFHIQGQALYTSFGYKNSNISAVDKSESYIGIIGNEKIDYVQIPITASYHFGFPKLHFDLGAGPYIAFKTNETLKIDNSGDTFKNTTFPIYTDGPTSVVDGGEVYASANYSRFFLAIQYQYNFNNIYHNTTGNAEWRVQNIGFSLGVFLK
jgi:hypothetical protein